MCGICGSLSITDDPSVEFLKNSTKKMMIQMTRRGPDDEGIWSDGKHCSFGFRRLSILDLSPTGHQPMLTQDERYALIFNGELYNFEEIRSELEGRGVRFRSTGDSEVVLYALAEWGVDVLRRFNGMFALAFYDTQAKTLLLARDHAGIKPLYYLHTPQGLVFASQYNQILQHPWCQGLPISQTALSLYLRFGWIPAPYAMLEHTHLLDAGCWLQIKADGSIQHGCYYAFPRFAQPTLQGESAVDALDEALSRAVKRQLISDVPVGVFLSGGIDSPLVAAKASQLSNQPLQAFTIGVSNAEMDESQDARRYAQELGLDLNLRMIDEQAALGMLDEVVAACTEPTADFSIFPTLLVSQLAHQQVKVVLSGDGGDEPFWGYPGRFGPVLEQAQYFRMPQLARYAPIAARRVLGFGKATREVLWPNIGRLYQKKHTILAEADLEACFPSLQPVPQDLDLFQYTGTDLQETAQWLRWNEFRLHLARILAKVDRASMHHSLEVRVPLLDKEVLAVAARTDWRTCLDLKQRLGKLPLRKVLARTVSHQTLAKKGFTVPMHQWLQGPLQELLRAEVLSRQDFFGIPVNQKHVNKMNQQLIQGDRSKAWGLWLLLSLSLWEKRHLAQRI